jgi:ribose transport system permease protein
MKGPRWKAMAGRQRGVVVLVVLVVVFSLLHPDFLSASNLNNLLMQGSITGVIAIAMAIAFIGREFDLSVGSVLALSGFVAVHVANVNSALAIVAAIGVGALCGVVNGVVVAVLRVNAFIATLGTMSILGGLTLLLSNQQAISTSANGFLSMAIWAIGPVPMYAIIVVALGIIAHWVMQRTPVGLTVRALGASAEFCRLNGVRSSRYRIGIFLVTGIAAGISGFMTASWVGGADPNAGQSTPIIVISAVVLGGVSLYGGEGTIWQAIAGAMVLTVFADGLTLADVSPYYQTAFEGLILVVVVTAAALLPANDMTRIWLGSLRQRLRVAWNAGSASSAVSPEIALTERGETVGRP